MKIVMFSSLVFVACVAKTPAATNTTPAASSEPAAAESMTPAPSAAPVAANASDTLSPTKLNTEYEATWNGRHVVITGYVTRTSGASKLEVYVGDAKDDISHEVVCMTAEAATKDVKAKIKGKAVRIEGTVDDATDLKDCSYKLTE
jgi:hypothetical protein